MRPCLAPANSRKVARSDAPVRVMDPRRRARPANAAADRARIGQPDLEVVAEAANGREAIDLAEQHRPDVIPLDLAHRR